MISESVLLQLEGIGSAKSGSGGNQRSYMKGVASSNRFKTSSDLREEIVVAVYVVIKAMDEDNLCFRWPFGEP